MPVTTAAPSGDSDNEIGHPPIAEPEKKSLSFWLIFLSICLSLFLSALELTGVSNALPDIIQDLEGAEFTWVGSAYSLASTAFLPMSGGVAEIFGRRLSMIGAIAIFALGSALCGAAQTMHWLIAARAIQGLGGGAILSISSIVVADLVSLKERGAYNGLLGLTWAIASGIGPVVGGALASEHRWRWLFYLNLPICGLSLVTVLLFLNLPTPKGSVRQKFGQMDWIGNLLFIASTTGVVLGLTWGGTTYSWASAAVLIPLIGGIIGYAIFFPYEFFIAKNPLIPFEILNNRTTMSGYIQNFINPLVLLSIAYYLPAYLQACHNASAVRSGVLILALSFILGPFAIVTGISVRVLQRYRPQLWAGWIFYIAGMAGLTTFTAESSTAVVIGVPALIGIACGILYPATYFPVLAPLPVSLNARALAFFAFQRSFAAVWGITIGSTILQNQLTKLLPPSVLASLASGKADLTFALIAGIQDLPEPTKHQVQSAFADAISVIWKTMTGFLAVGFLASFFMRDIPLQNSLDDKWASQATGQDTKATGNEEKNE